MQSYDDAAAYLVWDNDYLYICAVNTDDTPMVLEAAEKGWANDAAEFWLKEEGLNYKIHCAADGTFFLGGDADGRTPYDFSQAKSVSMFTDTGWCVEIALPLNDLKSGREFVFKLQVNNIIDNQGASGSASAGSEITFTCVD